MSQSILQVNNLSKHFGGLAAVSNCSLKIKEGSITGIIGPNGSGKTTLFNLIAGNLKSSKGEVVFNDENITDLPSHELFAKGLLRTFQIAHEFSNLTVLENLMMVPANQSGENLINALLKPGLVKKEEEQVRSKAYDVVEFLNLKHLANERALSFAKCLRFKNSTTSYALDLTCSSSFFTSPGFNNAFIKFSPDWFAGTIIKFSNTVRFENSCAIWKVLSNPLANNSWDGRSVIFSSLKTTSPLEDFRFPAIKLNNVVFPDPLGPIIPVIDPSLIFKEQLDTAASPPKCFDKLFTCKILWDI